MIVIERDELSEAIKYYYINECLYVKGFDEWFREESKLHHAYSHL